MGGFIWVPPEEMRDFREGCRQDRDVEREMLEV
jgi:hypothetical protein